MSGLRAIARRLGVGRGILRLRHHSILGLARSLELRAARKSVLPQIVHAPSAMRGEPAAEVHMLLGHSRVMEALWATLSLDYFGRVPLHVVIHDDGSLTSADRSLLAAKLPQLRVVSRPEADAVVGGELERRDLRNCLRFRNSFILARKIFDPAIFAERPEYVVLDSDVVFFGDPGELLGTAPGAIGSRYSTDNGYRYSFDEKELRSLAGAPPVKRLNSGVLRLRKGEIDLERIDGYLPYRGFWKEDGSADYYSEMTVFAIELTKARAQPLPPSYAIAPQVEDDQSFVAGHYCGGIRSAYLYYAQALPRLRANLLERVPGGADYDYALQDSR